MSVDEAYFLAHGAAPEQAAELARQHNTMTGAPTGKGPSVGPSATVPAAVSPPSASGTSTPSPRAEFDALVARRAAGQVSDYEWGQLTPRLRQLEASIAETEGPAQQAADVYAAPRTYLEYQLPTEPDATDEQLTHNRVIGEALLSGSVPTHIGHAIGADVKAFGASLRALPAVEGQARLAERHASISAQLDSSWGAQKEANLARIDAFAEQMQQRNPQAAAMLQTLYPLLSAMNLIQLNDWLVARRPQ